MNAIPFRVTAKLRGPMMRPAHGIYLDSLLMARVAVMEQRVPLQWATERSDPPIPIVLSECERVYLASAGIFEIEASERRFVNKRFPMGEAQAMGDLSLKRILVGGGLSKGFRTPRELVHLVNDQIVWFALGDIDQTRDVLETVSGLGPRRGVGHGDVASWSVEQVEPWEGFPVLRDGAPLRPLPLGWDGVRDGRLVRSTLRPPYHERWREEECVA
jgi:hypothetical protein